MCVDAGSDLLSEAAAVAAADGANDILSEITVAFTNPRVSIETLVLSVDVITPIQLRRSPRPVWPVLAVYGGAAVANTPLNLTRLAQLPRECSTLPAGNSVTIPSNYVVSLDSVNTGFVNDSMVSAYLIEWLRQYHAMNWTAAGVTPQATVLNQILGTPWSEGAQQSALLRTSSVVEPSATAISFQTAIDLNAAVQYCGATVDIGSDSSTYASTWWYAEHTAKTVDVTTGLSGSIATAVTFYTTVSQSGWILVSTSSRYHQRDYLQEMYYSNLGGVDEGDNNLIYTACPANEKRLFFSVRMEFGGVYDIPTTVVGPRNLTDIRVSDRSNPLANQTLYNCYGLKPVKLVRHGCYSDTNKCIYTVSFRTQQCRVIDGSGNAFSVCSYAHEADRVADNAAHGVDPDTSPYPVSLDAVQSFYVDVWQYPLTLAQSGNFAGGESELLEQYLVNSDPSGENRPDFVSLKIQAPVYPDVAQQVAYAIDVGVLPTLHSNASMFQIIQTNDTASGGGSKFFNHQLSLATDADAAATTSQLLIFMIQMQSTALRSLFDLRLNVSDSVFALKPLDGSGHAIAGRSDTPLNWTRLLEAETLPYVSKQYIADACPSCAIVPACLSQPGIDCFALHLPRLFETTGGANGYELKTKYHYSTAAPTSSPPARRRLLQDTTEYDAHTTGGSGHLIFRFLINGTLHNVTFIPDSLLDNPAESDEPYAVRDAALKGLLIPIVSVLAVVWSVRLVPIGVLQQLQEVETFSLLPHQRRHNNNNNNKHRLVYPPNTYQQLASQFVLLSIGVGGNIFVKTCLTQW